jgi:catechol 2,3-dioxygenase-like lactoylglutathione lyase family enzyme
VRAALLGAGESEIELLEPLDPSSGIGRFLARRGEGLHHLCFRAYAREDVNRLHAHLCEMGAKIVHPPEDGPWAPGYYSLLFEDPDGIRLEVNHVPGKGLLTDEARFNPVGYDVES